MTQPLVNSSSSRVRAALGGVLAALGLLGLFGCGGMLPLPNPGGNNGAAPANPVAPVAVNPAPANPAAPAGQPAVPAAQPGAPVQPAPAGIPGTPVAVATPVATGQGGVPGAQEQYGDQAGETDLPPDPQIPDALLHSRRDDTFFKLSNPRMGTSRFGRPLLMVDYEKTRVGKFGGASLIMHNDRGRRDSVTLFTGLHESRGTIDVEIITFGFNRNGVDRNLELYLVASDHRYGARAPRFKVSNSVVIGTMPKLTPVRHWTADELKMLTSPPPNYSNANAHPGIGLDTKLVGTEGGASMRYVEPQGRLIGLEFRLGEWEKVKCLGGLTPVFSHDQPKTQSERVEARPGYEVSGMNVKSSKFVNAIQLLYAKRKPDGQLDMADAYEGDWIGYPDDEAEPVKLGGEGRAVIGLHLKQGGVLNQVGLVLERR